MSKNLENAALPINDGEQLVTIELMMGDAKHNDSLFVSVNGQSIQLQRGKRTKIKRKFLWAIQDQLRQERGAALYIAEESQKAVHIK